MIQLFANSGDPDQTPHIAASDLGLHCLPNTLLGISRLQWVKKKNTGEVLLTSTHNICFHGETGKIFE